MHRIHLSILILKLITLLYIFTDKLVNYAAGNVATVILLYLLMTMACSALHWNFELFINHLSETIMLFNEIDPFSLLEHVQPLSAPTIILSPPDESNGSGRGYASMIEARGELWHTLRNCRLPELLLILCPFVINVFAPILVMMNLVFPDWNCFCTCLLPDEILQSSGWDWRFIMAVLFDAWAALVTQFAAAYMFFFELALQTAYFTYLQELHTQVEK